VNIVIRPKIPQSTKKNGRHENILIHKLVDYYSELDYEVYPHSSLNVSWGSVYVDLDVVLIKDGFVSYIEVKSKKDNFKRAYKQIENVKDFIDFAYIATDKKIIDFENPLIGLICILENEIEIKNYPKQLLDPPKINSILSLKKKCLERFFSDLTSTQLISSFELANRIYEKRNIYSKNIFKEIALCNQNCIDCPIDSVRKLSFYL